MEIPIEKCIACGKKKQQYNKKVNEVVTIVKLFRCENSNCVVGNKKSLKKKKSHWVKKKDK